MLPDDIPHPNTPACRPAPRETRVLAFHVGHASLYLGIYVDARLAHYCRLPLNEALEPGVLAERFFRSREPIHCVVFCSGSRSATPQIAGIIGQLTQRTPVELTWQSGHGLEIGYRAPQEFSSVRLAAVLGAMHQLPNRNLLVVDCSAATTFTAVRRGGFVAGGAIMHGFGLWPGIAARAANLSPIRGRYRLRCLARSAGEALASGAFHGHAGALRELRTRMAHEAFGRERHHVVATGPEAKLFQGCGIFDSREQRLVLIGLRAFAKTLLPVE